MYYCKKCGKALPDNARFCDRCNTSVRQQSRKKALIDDLKEERLARQKAKEVEKRLRNIKKIRHRRIKLIIVAVIVLILLGVAAEWHRIYFSLIHRRSKTGLMPYRISPRSRQAPRRRARAARRTAPDISRRQ